MVFHKKCLCIKGREKCISEQQAAGSCPVEGCNGTEQRMLNSDLKALVLDMH